MRTPLDTTARAQLADFAAWLRHTELTADDRHLHHTWIERYMHWKQADLGRYLLPETAAHRVFLTDLARTATPRSGDAARDRPAARIALGLLREHRCERRPPVAVAAGSTPHTLVLELKGEIDLATASTYRQALERAVTHAAHADLVVLDLRRVAFCGAAGLRVLLAAAEACARRDVTFTVAVEPASQLDRVIVLTGLDDRLQCYSTPRSARDAHRSSPAGMNTTTRKNSNGV